MSSIINSIANKRKAEPMAVYIRKKYIALIFLNVEPQTPIIKIIGISIISKKIKNNNKSKLKKVPSIANSKNKKSETYMLLNIISLLYIDQKHNGKMKEVNNTNIIEKPSTPSTNCI